VVEGFGASLSAGLCLRFVVFAAARSGGARSAVWDEIGFDACECRLDGDCLGNAVLLVFHYAAGALALLWGF